MFNHIIYHKNCPDGFTSLVILKYLNLLSKKCFIYADIPSTESLPLNIKNKDIIIVDVAYKVSLLKEICQEAKSVFFIDHHTTQLKEKQSLKIPNLKMVLDSDTHSACYLTWKQFSNKKVPLFVKYVSDNDTGTWKYKNTSAFITALNVEYRYENPDSWLPLFIKKNVKKMIKKGKVYMKYTEHLLEASLKQHIVLPFPSEKVFKKYPKIANKVGQYLVAIHNGSCPSTTLVGNNILKNIDCDFVVVYSSNLERRRYNISFRSKNVNVEHIAKQFGGGGHIHASACNISFSDFHIEDLFCGL